MESRENAEVSSRYLKMCEFAARIIVYAFVFCAIGAVLLSFPFCFSPHADFSFGESFSGALTAITLNGLFVKNSAEYFSGFGLFVIWLLMQAGGFFILSICASFIKIARIPSEETLCSKQAPEKSLSVLSGIAKPIILYMLISQIVSCILFLPVMVSAYGLSKGVLHSIFLGTSAFLNCGILSIPIGEAAVLSNNIFYCLAVFAACLMSAIGLFFFDVFIIKKEKTVSQGVKPLLIGYFIILAAAFVVGLLYNYELFADSGLSLFSRAARALALGASGGCGRLISMPSSGYPSFLKNLMALRRLVGGVISFPAGGLTIYCLVIIGYGVYKLLKREKPSLKYGISFNEALLSVGIKLSVAILCFLLLGGIQHTPGFASAFACSVAVVSSGGGEIYEMASLHTYGKYIMLFAVFIVRYISPLVVLKYRAATSAHPLSEGEYAGEAAKFNHIIVGEDIIQKNKDEQNGK